MKKGPEEKTQTNHVIKIAQNHQIAAGASDRTINPRLTFRGSGSSMLCLVAVSIAGLVCIDIRRAIIPMAVVTTTMEFLGVGRSKWPDIGPAA